MEKKQTVEALIVDLVKMQEQCQSLSRLLKAQGYNAGPLEQACQDMSNLQEFLNDLK